MAVAIDKISTMTLPNYSGLGVAIKGLTAKQAALVLSTRNLSQAELEEVVRVNNLIEKYGAEQLIKTGLLSRNSSLLVSEKAVSAEKLKESIIQSAINKEKAEEFIQTQLIVTANGEESASTILLNKALLDEAVKRGILTKEKATEILSTYGVVVADNTEIGSKKGLIAATYGLIKSKLALSALDSAVVVGISALVFTIYKCNNAVKEARDKAQELGISFKEASSTIEDYKSKIEELYKVINDSNSSIEDVTNARKTLMSVQDELIEKFGTEESVIRNVTDAINGQTDALDVLTRAKWQEVKNEFNDGDFWNDIANFFQGTDNIERMLSEYGERRIAFDWIEYTGGGTKLTDDIIAKLENIGIDIMVSGDTLDSLRDFDSLTESIVGNATNATLVLSGNAEEIYNKILSLQNLVNGDDSFGNLYKNIERHANSYKELTDKYKDFYDQYILYEKILAEDSDYADTFKEITDAAEKYNEAFMSGNEEEIKRVSDEYASLLSTAMAAAIANGDSDIATYFENMFPTLKSIVDSWNFNVAFDANTGDLQTKVQSVLDGLMDKDGRSLTTEEILGLGEADEQYQSLVSIAHSYNMSIEEMIDLLKERNLVSAMDYQGLVGLFGQKNVDKLSTGDIEIAYTIKNVGNMTFDELQAAIEKTKEVAEEPVVSFSISDTIDQLNTKLKPAFDSLKSAWQDIFTDDGFDKDAVDIPMLNSIKSSIEEINKLGINIDLSVFDSFATKLTDVNTTEEQAKQAFNDFATSIFYATGATNGITAETKELVEQLLESLGVVNASEVAEYSLAAAERELLEAKAQSIVATYDLVNASNEDYVALLEEAGAAGVAKQQIYNLAAAEIAYSTSNLSVEQKIQKLKELASAYGDTTTAALATAIANDLASGHTDVDSALNDLMRQINSTMQEVDIKFPEIDFSGLEKKASKAGSKTGDAYMDALKDKLSNFGNVIKYISDNIGDQIGLFEDQKNAAVEALEAQQKAAKEALEAEKALVQEQIDAKQAEIDKIQEVSKARKNEIDLQQKQIDLTRLQNQKTIFQYSEGKGMHYVTDTKKIRDAQNAVTEAKENIQIANLQKEISGLDDTIDNLEKKIEESNDYYAKLIEQAKNYWDALIKGLEDYKSRWTELANIEEQAKMEVTLRNLGITADDILNMSESTFDSFKSNYLGVLQEMYAGNDQMISMLQELGGISPEAVQPLSDSLGNAGDVASDTKDRISEIADELDNLDGMTSECTVKVNIVTVGSIPQYVSKIPQKGSIDPISDKSQNKGIAHYEGTASVTGDWSVQSNENDALVGEEGYEIIVRDGRFFTVGDNGPEMYPIKRGDIVFNHEQSEELLKNGHTSGRGKAYADGTVGGGKFLTPSGMILAPYDPSKDDSYFAKLYTAWNTRYGNVEKNVEDINRTLSQHLVIEHNKQMNEEVNRFVNNSSSVVNNKNVQPVVNQNITLNCPNVTNNSGVEYIQKELGHLSLKALQEPLRDY